ncbi:MAG: hypothetical protein DELT_01708 [Desulfovibrio sp.]
MSNFFDPYKGYTGSIGVSTEDRCLYGNVQGVSSMITYEAETVAQLEEEFRASVDEYLEMCAEFEKEPEKPFASNILLRLDQDTHKKIFYKAKKSGKSKNKYIVDVLQKHLEQEENTQAQAIAHGLSLPVKGLTISPFRTGNHELPHTNITASWTLSKSEILATINDLMPPSQWTEDEKPQTSPTIEIIPEGMHVQ